MTRDNSHNVRVLVVDDERLIRWSVSEALADAGATAVEAVTAHAALAAIRNQPRPFDAALLDVSLADNSGLALLAAVRRLSPATRVVLMTAAPTPALRAGARTLGAVDVIEKPFDLPATIKLVLASGAVPPISAVL